MAKKYPRFARSVLKGLFGRSKVFVNGSVAKAGQKLRSGDRVSVDDSLLMAEPPSINLPIIYEDRDVIVVNKPAGILTHSKSSLNLEPTIASFLRSKINDKSLKGNRAGVVHRLDRMTSGVLIGAKNQPALGNLQKQFAARQTIKTYIAVVHGKPVPAEALIDAPIERNPKRPQTFRVAASGKSAQTRYIVKKNLSKAGRHYSVVELKPATGRTHQVRVHLAYIGHPVVGDALYGKPGEDLLLHAFALELTLPSGERKKFKVPLPPQIKEFIK